MACAASVTLCSLADSLPISAWAAGERSTRSPPKSSAAKSAELVCPSWAGNSCRRICAATDSAEVSIGCTRAVSVAAAGSASGCPRRSDARLDRELREALGHGGRQARADLHALGRLLALEVTGGVVQLRQAPALGVGHEQLDGLQGAAERRLDGVLERFEPLPRDPRDEHAVGMAEAQFAAALVVEHVGLVEHEQPGLGAGVDLLEHVVDGAHHPLELLLGDARVDDVKDQVGQPGLLERGA